MNYDNFFNKEYLKDLVDNEDVFIDVFKKIEGYNQCSHWFVESLNGQIFIILLKK